MGEPLSKRCACKRFHREEKKTVSKSDDFRALETSSSKSQREDPRFAIALNPKWSQAERSDPAVAPNWFTDFDKTDK